MRQNAAQPRIPSVWQRAESNGRDRLQREFGEGFVPLLFDVTDEEGVQAGAAKVSEHLGRNMLDGLVNNAGIEVIGRLADLPTDQFQHQLEVNLVGPFIVTKAFLPLLGADLTREGRPGRIALSVASIFNNSRTQRLHR